MLASLGRIAAAVALVLLAAALAGWYIYGPVRLRVTDGRHDRGRNAIWIGHGWLGDDGWFDRNKRPRAAFRTRAAVGELAARFERHGIRDVYPHLCPATVDGALPPVDAVQTALFLDVFRGFRVMPWVGGNRATALVGKPEWRARFAGDCAALTARFPRLAGFHLNIEPCPSGSADLLALLDLLRAKLPRTCLLSIAAYPPPTRMHPGLDVHWEEAYVREVARRVDQMAFMMYDTALDSTAWYQRLMAQWTREELAWTAPTATLLGLPAYDDAWTSWHRPDVENLENALEAIHAALAGMGGPPPNYQGTALYCDWEMNEAKWATYRELYLSRRSASTASASSSASASPSVESTRIDGSSPR